MRHQIVPAFRLMLVLTVLTGLIYPGVVTGLCQVLFRWQANGSMLSVGEKRSDRPSLGRTSRNRSISIRVLRRQVTMATTRPLPQGPITALRTRSSLIE